MEELLSDSQFLAWYFKTDPQAEIEWKNKIAADPNLQHRVDEAVHLLQTIILKEQPISGQRVQKAEARLMQATLANAGQPVSPVVPIKRQKLTWWAAAAAICISTLGIWQYFRGTDKLMLQTAFGETRKEVLPDGSQVMLNANSSIEYNNWKEGSDREVWVHGEAFFQVNKTEAKDKFIVHTGHFDVVVTGTQFNVINRSNRNNVLLKEGRVTIQGAGKDVEMQPGEFVEFNNTGIEKKTINDAPVLAWTEHRFIFDNTPLKEVANLVTEIFGVKVSLADEALADSTVSGILPSDNLDSFLQVMDALPDVAVERREREILFRKK